MALLNIVKPEKAEGETKEYYSLFENIGVDVPLPMQMYSTSPYFLKRQRNNIQYMMEHKTLSFSLLTHIRFLVSKMEDYPYCINLNRGVLKNFAGLSNEQLDNAASNPEKASLEPKEKMLLQFVLNTVQDPATTDPKQVDELRKLGWSDQDIFDATMQGMNMMYDGMVFKAFKMGEEIVEK
jgi:hypothetical protein